MASGSSLRNPGKQNPEREGQTGRPGWFSKTYFGKSSIELLELTLLEDGWEEVSQEDKKVWRKVLPESTAIEARLAYSPVYKKDAATGNYLLAYGFTDYHGFREISPELVLPEKSLTETILRQVLTKAAAYMEKGFTDKNHNQTYKMYKLV